MANLSQTTLVTNPVRVEPPIQDQSRSDTTQSKGSPASRMDIEGPTARLIAFMNQKGGVGKTTTTVNIGAGLARLGKRVLVIDLDPQGHLSLHLGVNPEELEMSVYDLMTDPDISAGEVAYQVRNNLVLLPADVNLAGVESELSQRTSKDESKYSQSQDQGQGIWPIQNILRDRCMPLVRREWFDYVLIDCPPSLGLLTVNALSMAQEVYVPMQAHFLALQGLSKLLETVGMVRNSLNTALIVSGVILCMHEAQTLLAQEVTADLEAFLAQARGQDVPWRDAKVLQPPVRRNIKLAESPSFGQTIFDYAPDCAGANDYLALAQAVIDQRVEHPPSTSH